MKAWRDVASIPNSDGYALTVLLKSGARVETKVARDPSTGLHSLPGIAIADVDGWLPNVAESLLAAGAKSYAMMPEAIAAVRGLSPAQAIFFAMTSRREDARVYAASIGKDAAARIARQIGGVVKLGYVANGIAYVLPKRA